MKTSGKVKVVLSNAMGQGCNWSVEGFAALLVDGIAAAGTLEHAMELASGLTALLAKNMLKRLPKHANALEANDIADDSDDAAADDNDDVD